MESVSFNNLDINTKSVIMLIGGMYYNSKGDWNYLLKRIMKGKSPRRHIVLIIHVVARIAYLTANCKSAEQFWLNYQINYAFWSKAVDTYRELY